MKTKVKHVRKMLTISLTGICTMVIASVVIASGTKAISMSNFYGTEPQYLMLFEPKTKCKYQAKAIKDEKAVERWRFVIISSDCNGIVQEGDEIKYKSALPDNNTGSFIESGSSFTIY